LEKELILLLEADLAMIAKKFDERIDKSSLDIIL